MKWFKVFLRILGIVIGVIILYVLVAIAISYIPVNKKAKDIAEVEIYILTNGVHTDIVVPFKHEVMDWSTYLNPALTEGKIENPAWVAFGWGDKGFYLQTPEWADLKASVAFKAATGLSESAMHVTYYNRVKEGDDCVKINISKAHYKKMIAYIHDSFDRKNNAYQLIITDQNYGTNDLFYEAKGSYSLFYTCNTWANNVLKKGNQKAALFTLLDKGIFYHYRN